MQLGHVFNSMPAWQTLAAMRMTPKVGYKILKYVKKVMAEHEVAEKQRVALIHEITNTEEGQDARIEPNTQQFTDYIVRFNEVLQTECELKPFELPMSEVLASIGADQDGSLSVQDLALLEPFFQEE